jgi:hypothetical protein
VDATIANVASVKIVAFTLTLTLSLREREQQADALLFPDVRLANPALSIAVRMRTILPLPAGEGRGEGERGEQTPRASSLSISPPNELSFCKS